MSTMQAIESDAARLSFSVEAKTVLYGDDRTFYEFRVLMRHRGRVVGVQDGPGRTHATRADARRAGYALIRELRTHRLYVIHVTESDIRHGEGHSCQNCAIARALGRNMERMGFNEWAHFIEVVPCACFTDADGVSVVQQGWPYARVTTGQRGMPDLVTNRRGKFWSESMYEWAMHWDEWADSRVMSLAEWREQNGYDDGERPRKPSPCWFVLDLTSMSTQPRPA